MNWNEIKQAVRELDPDLEEGSDAFNAAGLLLLSAGYGYDKRRLRRLSGLSEDFIERISANCKDGRLWRGGRVYGAQWMDEETGGCAFWLDVNVALGRLERAVA